METLLEPLRATAPVGLGFGRVPLEARSYLLPREAGNLLVYGPGPAEPEAGEIAALGGVARQYLNHRHEASPAGDRIREAFGAPLFCHRDEAPAVSEVCRVSFAFSRRHLLDDDFEVIPAPGHTSGATIYLWTAGGRRYLFSGDTIFMRRGEWVAAVLDGVSDRGRYLESLAMIRRLDFDVLVPGIAPVGEAPIAEVDHADADRRIGAIIERLRRGQDG